MRRRWITAFLALSLITVTSSAAWAGQDSSGDTDDMDDICERFPCVEVPSPFSPMTIGQQLGVGALGTGAAVAAGYGFFRLTSTDGDPEFISLVGLGPGPLVAGVTPPLMGTQRGGYGNTLGSVLGAMGAFVGGIGFAFHRYGDGDRDPSSLVLRLTAISSASVLVGSTLGYHVEDALWAKFGDRPVVRLANMEVAPAVVPTGEGAVVLLGWSGRF